MGIIYDSKDDNFAWKSVEINSESYDIPQARNISTKDRKGKVNSTSEELEVGQIFF